MTSSTAPTPTSVGRLASVSLDCTNPSALADFYGALLGLPRAYESSDGAVVSLSDGGVAVTMMRSVDHVAPTWPDPGQPQQLHLDVLVSDLQDAVKRAVALGATEAAHQPAPSAWRVLVDPAGHPFCLTTITGD